MAPRRAKSRKKERRERSPASDAIQQEHKTGLVDLPLEIKHMIFEEVFRGSKIVYNGGAHSTDLPIHNNVFQLIEVTDHRNILRISKQLRAEGIALYYQRSEFTMNYSWTENQIHEHIPKALRRHVSSLKADILAGRDLPLSWVDMDCKLRSIFPNLRELYLPCLEEPGPQETAGSSKILGEFRKSLAGYEFSAYHAYKAAWRGLNVIQRFRVKVLQYWWRCELEIVEIMVDCKSSEIVSCSHDIDEDTKLEDLIRPGEVLDRTLPLARWRLYVAY